MRKNQLIIFSLILFVIYSLFLFNIEYKEGQDMVRNYFTDIKGPVFLFAINTTLNMLLLAFCGLIFYLGLGHLPKEQPFLKTFAYSQIFIFLFLALDERFLIHENLGEILGIEDALILLFIGVIDLFFLYKYYRTGLFSMRQMTFIAIGGFFFVTMTVIDALLPLEQQFRLSAEDISKVWSSLFLFFFALDFYKSRALN